MFECACARVCMNESVSGCMLCTCCDVSTRYGCNNRSENTWPKDVKKDVMIQIVYVCFHTSFRALHSYVYI